MFLRHRIEVRIVLSILGAIRAGPGTADIMTVSHGRAARMRMGCRRVKAASDLSTVDLAWKEVLMLIEWLWILCAL